MIDDDMKRRVLAELTRFEAMRERVGALPTVQDLDGIKGADPDAQRKRAILKLVIQSHTLIAHVVSEIVESEDHYHDIQKEMRINSLWREIVTLRDILPTALAHERVLEGAKTGGRIRGKQQQREKEERNDVAIVRGRGNVSSIVIELALRKDSMGDYLSPKDELWAELIGSLDTLLLSPKEVVDDSGSPIRIDYCDEDGRTGQITFGSFKTMVYTARKK